LKTPPPPTFKGFARFIMALGAQKGRKKKKKETTDRKNIKRSNNF